MSPMVSWSELEAPPALSVADQVRHERAKMGLAWGMGDPYGGDGTRAQLSTLEVIRSYWGAHSDDGFST